MLVTADRPGYVIDIEGPDKATDELTVEPQNGTYSVRSRQWGDVSAIESLSSTPVVLPLTVNYWVRFEQSGDYVVRVATRRVRIKDPDGWAPAPNLEPLRLVSNEVAFHVEVLDEAHEGYLVAPAMAAVDASMSADLTEQIRAAEQLAFLPGDAAALAKFRAYRTLGSTHISSNARNLIRRGFAISRRPSLILDELERELIDTNRAVSAETIGDATSLRMLIEHPETRDQGSGPFPPGFGSGPWTAIRDRYVNEAMRSLSARTSRNRLESATELLHVAGRPTPPDVLDIVIGGFDQLPIDQRHDLLIGTWQEIADPRLVPSLIRGLREASPTDRDAFAAALIRIDPAAAAGPIVSALADPATVIYASTLERAPKGLLAGAGASLVAAIRAMASDPSRWRSFQLESKTSALSLVGDGSLRAEVRALFDAPDIQLTSKARIDLAGYLARWDGVEGFSTARRLAIADSTGRALAGIVHAAGADSLRPLMREQLFAPAADAAATAASLLAQYGEPGDEVLIGQRLSAWQTARRADPAPITAQDGYTERDFASAIRHGRAWTLSDADAARLAAACLSDACRAVFAGDRNRN